MSALSMCFRAAGAVVLIATLSACAGVSATRGVDQPAAVEEPASAPSPYDAADVVTLERGACFGACPIYTVTIRGDGSVTYQGQRFVEAMGEQSDRVTPQAFAGIIAKANAARFFDLRPEYRAQITDIPTYVITVTLDGRTHRVVDYGGVSAGMPQAVRALENEIDRATGASRWTGQQPPLGGP